MNIPVTKAEVLQLTEEEHAQIDELLENLNDSQLTKLGIPVGWEGVSESN